MPIFKHVNNWMIPKLKDRLDESGMYTVSYLLFCRGYYSQPEIEAQVTKVRQEIQHRPVAFIDWEHDKILSDKTFDFVGFPYILGPHHDTGNWVVCVPTLGDSRFGFKAVSQLDFLIYVNEYNEEFELDKIDHSKKSKDFLYLNGKAHEHRVKLLERLLDKDLLRNSIWSASSPTQSWGKLEKKLDPNYEWPQWRGKSVNGYDDSTRKIYFPQYNDSICSIVPETEFQNGYHYITEKTCKPLMAEHLFVVLAGAGYLKTLRNLGFRTFGDHIDESYDEVENLDLRIEKIVDTLEYITKTDATVLYKNTEEIRRHNRELFFSEQFYREYNDHQIRKIRKLMR